MAATPEAMNWSRAFEAVKALRPQEGLWIAGRQEAASHGGTFDVLDPSTDDLLAPISDGTLADGERAVAVAAQALPEWSQTSPRARAEILRRAYELMVRDAERLAAILSIEQGKPLPDALGEVRYARQFFRWFSEEAARMDGNYFEAPDGGTRTIVTHRPIGVASLVTPWNFPAAMVTRKLAPAIAAGCSMVLKPAALTPLTALAVVQLLKEAGLPDGVVNMVPTSRAAALSNSWLANPEVRVVSFTGSTQVGSAIMAEAAKRIVSVSMELGGNAPFVVAPDADIDAAVAGAVAAKLRNGGQACTAANRFLVHEKVAGEFNTKLAQAFSDLQVGLPFDAAVKMGPVVSRTAQREMEGYIDQAVAEGGTIAATAKMPSNLPNGYFFAPTLVTGLELDSALMQQELFGPIAPVATWSSRDEVLQAANSVDVGLASYIYSGDLQWALKFAEDLEFGMTAINRGFLSDPAAPFGGTKGSGIGREGAREGLREFQETQYFTVAW